MHIKSVIIDGFKPYGRRTELHGFGPDFNAITDLDVTGKSTILDAICFVLGISNLGQLRAASLQDLVFKCGQTGVGKATVTLVFDNTNQSQSPMEYQNCQEISVTRQIVIGGKNEYIINGKSVQNKKVIDLFCSAQLNVNNPNFMITQGRITEVLNMNPQEILSMIEEAAGTSMYETKLIEEQKVKLRETNRLLKEEELKLEKQKLRYELDIEFQKMKAAQDTIIQKSNKIKTLDKNTKADEELLQKKEIQTENVGGLFEKLEEACENDVKLYTQKKFEAVTPGLSTNEDGGAASLQAQLMTAKQQIIEAEFTIEKSGMELKYCKNTLERKQADLKNKYKNIKIYADISLDIQKLKTSVEKMQFEDSTIEKLVQDKKAALSTTIQRLKQDLDQRKAYRYELQYRDPEPNFDRTKVLGMVGKLFTVEREVFSLALSVCAGGSLYSYVTDDDITSNKIIKDGNLQRRVTIIPMNKIIYHCLKDSVIKLAENLVGKDNVAPALSLIKYDPNFEPVMKLVFGNTFICKDMDIAKKVAYHPKIMSRCVTLEGDLVEPEDTLTGGPSQFENNVLKNIAEIGVLEQDMENKTQEMGRINQNIEREYFAAKTYNLMKDRLKLRQHELNMWSQRLALSPFLQNQREIEDHKQKIETLEKNLISAREEEKLATARVKDTEAKLSDRKSYRDRELKSAAEFMKAAKTKSEESRENLTKREQERETLRLEVDEIKSRLTKSKEQFEAFNKENEQLLLDIKKHENELTKVKNDRKALLDEISYLENNYEWIKEDRELFGKENTRYDYSKEDPEAARKKLIELQEKKTKMERNINFEAMMLLDREEERYNETMRRKKIVEDDVKEKK